MVFIDLLAFYVVCRPTIALRLDGYKLGVITTFILDLSPIFIGNRFNNERDFISVLGLDLAIFGLFLSSGLVFPVLKHPIW